MSWRLFLMSAVLVLAACESSPSRELPRATETNVSRGPECPDAGPDAGPDGGYDGGLFCHHNQDGLWPPCTTDSDCVVGTCSAAGFCNSR